jgi:chromosome transmission fidelity protein 1
VPSNGGSLCDQIEAAKHVFLEPMKATADTFDQVLTQYKNAADTDKGAILLAVLRGRSSEGLNFSHDHARCVIMVRSEL